MFRSAGDAVTRPIVIGHTQLHEHKTNKNVVPRPVAIREADLGTSLSCCSAALWLAALPTWRWRKEMCSVGVRGHVRD